MKTPFSLFLCAVLLVPTACSRPDRVGESAVSNDTTAEAVRLAPGARSVTIGEGGPGLAACGARAHVVNLSADGQPYLPVRAAPFTEADEVARLSNGARLFVCTRSIDQAWRGVVIPPAYQPNADCGVSAAVASVQPYTGPCKSGWVASDYLELSAG